MKFSSVFFLLLIQPISYLIEVSFLAINEVFNNVGLAVIGVSFVVSLFCLPLYMVAEKWQDTERNTLKKLQPGIQRIKAVFKGDEQYMILSTFYKENGYHPIMALRSSFGLLIQIPFFIAAYDYLSNLELLHGYSFLFIKDFGLPDSTFHIGSFPINVLPIAMTLINCISSAVYTRGHDIKEKIQVYAFAAIFLILLYDSPAGLVVYWTMNNVFSLVKNVFYKLKNPKKVIYILLCILGLSCIILPFTLFSSKKTLIKIGLFGIGCILICIPILLRLFKLFYSKYLEGFSSSKNLFSIFLVSGIGLALLVGLFIPSMLIVSETDKFCYVDGYSSPSIFIFNTLFQSLGLFVIWPAFIYFLFSKKAKAWLSFLMSGLFFYGLINTFVFAGKYGPMEQNLFFMTTQDFAPSRIELLLNLFSLLLILFLIVFVINKKSSVLKTLNYIVILSISVISISNAFSINRTYRKLPEPVISESVDPIYHLSKSGKNVIVIMQDRLFMPYVDEIIQDFPEIKNSFSGFTFYKNTVSMGNLTMVGVPGIFGGYDYTPFMMNLRTDQTLQQKHNQSILTMPILFNQAGYSVTVSNMPYENYLEAPYSQIYDDYPFVNRINTHDVYSELWYRETGFPHQKHLATEINHNMFWYGLFKLTPPVLRRVVYHNNYWNSIDFSSNNQELFVNTYTPMYYFKNLTDFTSTDDNFILIDNEMTHRSLVLDSPDYLPEKSQNLESFPPQSREAQYPTMVNLFKIYSDFFNYLRDNDVYDNTRIIIVSDHGMSVSSDLFTEHEVGSKLKENYVATLLVKDFGCNDEYSVDDTFMTNADTPLLALQGICNNARNPFTGNLLKVDNKADYTIMTMGESESTQSRYHSRFDIKNNQWAYVSDDIYVDDNWKVLSSEEFNEIQNKLK